MKNAESTLKITFYQLSFTSMLIASNMEKLVIFMSTIYYLFLRQMTRMVFKGSRLAV
jgi:hypothetical protein